MAASEGFFRNVKTLHVVFALSCLLMLATVIGMFAEDYYRPWKQEQRVFRDVEEEVAKRAMLAATPSKKALDNIVAAEQDLAARKAEVTQAKTELEKKHGELLARKLKTENRQRGIKADFDSIMSFYNQATEQGDAGAISGFESQLKSIKALLDAADAEVEKNQAEYDDAAKNVGLPEKEAKLKAAEAKHKELLADFDRFVKLVSQKNWTWRDDLRNFPVLDAFNAPTKIEQITLNDLPIDYSFKYVTRYDRCTTCHLAIDRVGFEKDVLKTLTDAPDKNLFNRFDVAAEIINKRNKDGAGLPNPKYLEPAKIDLSAARIAQFCSHPRQDLFVDANSAHPKEKFGCTICHAGQGSATTFFNASHVPNTSPMMERWEGEYGWKSNHYWDFPMLPNRFIESTCVKCHYEVTDLVRDGVKVEAPKLVRGYNLVRDMGCFGCHEISGIKGGRWVGPDLRLEPDPPLDSLTPTERIKATADPLNPPGAMRKVGPSISRLAEKTNEDWVRKWLKNPRGFRPETRMPHFYLQPNNSPELLPSEQKKFPDTEISAVAFYLMRKSEGFVNDVKRYHGLKGKAVLTDTEKADLAALEQRYEVRVSAPPAASATLPPSNPALDGRVLFTQKGCLACHTHEATASDGQTAQGKKVPALAGESDFGPDLSRLALKLGTEAGKPETARKWLVAWLLNPAGHSPRTRMPSVQLTPEEANEISGWLLSQKGEWTPDEVAPAERETLEAMARLYLEKVLTKSETRTVLANGFTDERLKQFAADADERELSAPLDEGKLKMFVGKKAISNMGCFGCHSIPGFQSAKPIGTALNEWGKKDADRLAFENSDEYVKKHFHIVERRDDPKDPAKPAADWKVSGKKLPYEKYFADMLDHHHRNRAGFLALKLAEPRAFDYERIKAWDDRARMPQFQFAHVKRLPNESGDQYEARRARAEAEAREAVMTFVLGLVAEPIPATFVHQPSGDRLAEVKGRQVLDKFNCGGCHIIRPGEIDFKPLDLKRFETHPEIRKPAAEEKYKGDDYVFPNHNAWTGTLSPKPDRALVRGVVPPIKEEDEDPKLQFTWLAQAFEFKVDGKVRDIPAGAALALSKDSVTAQYPQYGGRFTEQLAQFLQKYDAENYAGSKVSYAFTAAPPTLINEGEKTQPAWLYQFLLNPFRIRPLTVLRMPKFNMSEEEAKALVNYFTAVDRSQNPGIGVIYPYVTIPERDEAYIRQKTAEYVARLKQQGKFEAWKKELLPIWEEILKDKLAEAKQRQADTAKGVAAAPNDAAKAEAEKLKTAADAEVKKLEDKLAKKDVSDLERQWEDREAYLADGARLVKHGNLCLTCHSVGAVLGKEDKGPNLDIAADRLRSDWMERWIANPTRFLHYTSVMPINFKANATENQDAFVGPSNEQIRAARDFLTLYPQIRDWAIIRKRPMLGMTSEGGK